MVPGPNEWNTCKLSGERRNYLDEGLSFEEIADAIASEANITEACVEPCTDSKGYHRVQVSLEVCKRTYDLFYNSADGIRGRYWQCPTTGEYADRYLVGLLRDKLLDYLTDNPLPDKQGNILMSDAELEASLGAKWAKVWVDRDKELSWDCQGLLVPKWAKHENEKRGNPCRWRVTPLSDDLVIKGAFVNPAQCVCITSGKLYRAEQINRYGWTWSDPDPPG